MADAASNREYVARFVSHDRRFFQALLATLPVLRRLVFKTVAFFDEVGDARDLSWRNVVSFCLAVTALLSLGYYGGAGLVAWMSNPAGDVGQPQLSRAGVSVALWITLFLALVVGAVVSATVNVCTGVLLRRRFSFQRLVVSSLYVNTLIVVLNVAILLVGFGLSLFQRSKVPGLGFADPSALNQVVDVSRTVFQAIWTYVLVPALVLLAAVRATGVGPVRLFLAELGFFALATISILALLFAAHLVAA